MSPSPSPPTKTPLKRLLSELNALRSHPPGPPIERLEPVSEDDLFHWEAVVNGRGMGGGYDGGRWKLDIVVPDAYPNKPPRVRFVTRVVGSNVQFEVWILLPLCALFLVACARRVRFARRWLMGN
jgi:peroxin-4